MLNCKQWKLYFTKFLVCCRRTSINIQTVCKKYKILLFHVFSIVIFGLIFIWILYFKFVTSQLTFKEITLQINGLGTIDTYKSSCTIDINMDYLGRYDSIPYNTIKINHYRPDGFIMPPVFSPIFLELYSNSKDYQTLYKISKNVFEEVDSTFSLYYIRYKSYSSEINNFAQDKACSGYARKFNSRLPMSFSSTPTKGKDDGGEYVIGYGLLLFPYMDCDGELRFYTNVDHEFPSMLRRRDISKMQFSLKLITQTISCDTLRINFQGNTKFSNIYPQPEIVASNYIEYNTSSTIGEIIDRGVLFYAEFDTTKGMQNFREYLIIGLISILSITRVRDKDIANPDNSHLHSIPGGQIMAA